MVTKALCFIPCKVAGGKNFWKLRNLPLYLWATYNLSRIPKSIPCILSSEVSEEQFKRKTRNSALRHDLPDWVQFSTRSKNYDPATWSITDVLIDFIYQPETLILPDIIVLIQPTSPFIRKKDILDVVNALKKYPSCASAQTIVRVPHNFHETNQRIEQNLHVRQNFRISANLLAGLITFAHPEKRLMQFNKQLKPERWAFGNVVAVRTEALLAQKQVFAEPSFGIPIPRAYAFDVDTKEDLKMAEAMWKGGLYAKDQ